MKRAPAVLAVLTALAASSLNAQEMDRWLSRSAEARAYAAIEGDLRAIAAGAVAAGVPERLLVDRLVEGSRKKAGADRMLEALKAEAARLAFIAKTLDADWPDAGSKRRESAMAEVSIALRAGVIGEEWSAASRCVRDAKGPLDRAIQIVDMLAAVDPARLIGPEDRLRLVAAIAASRLRTGSIDSLVSVFSRGRARGLSPASVAGAVVEALSAGGNLASIDRVLEGYRRDR